MAALSLPRVDDTSRKEAASSTSYLDYKVMTINMNGKGTANDRRDLITRTISEQNPSVIFCQEPPGCFKEKVVKKCCKDDYAYKDFLNGKEAAVMWRTQDFNGKVLEPSDSSIIEIRDRVARKRSDIDTSEVLTRTVMVKLQSRGEACPPFLAVSWHGPFSRKTLDRRKKAFNGLICVLKEICKEKDVSSFIIGGDFNLNTLKDLEDEDLKTLNVFRSSYELSARGSKPVRDTMKKKPGRPYVPYKDNFLFCSMPSGDIKVSSVKPIEVDGSKQDPLDHDPIIGVLQLIQTGIVPNVVLVEDAVCYWSYPNLESTLHQSKIWSCVESDEYPDVISRVLMYRFLTTDIHLPSKEDLSSDWSDSLMSYMRLQNDDYDDAWRFAIKYDSGPSNIVEKIKFGHLEDISDLVAKWLEETKHRGTRCCCCQFNSDPYMCISFLSSPNGYILVIDSYCNLFYDLVGTATILENATVHDWFNWRRKNPFL